MIYPYDLLLDFFNLDELPIGFGFYMFGSHWKITAIVGNRCFFDEVEDNEPYLPGPH